ncbi:hypothetical protein [Microbacterium hominis]|nr:hypothetical protein [Microbacterium hominis]KXC05887.1 hypothetical protein MhomT_07950 [Microbacterium hominis]
MNAMELQNSSSEPATEPRGHRRMRRAAVLAAALCAVSLLGLTTPARAADVARSGGTAAITPAAAIKPMSTGQYEYICQMPNGQSWSLYVGEKTTDCKGSYLQKYINGRMIANYKLAYGGQALASNVDPGGCLLGIASTAIFILWPSSGWTQWAVSGLVAGLSLKPCYAV